MKKRILVIDDELSIRMLLENFLSKTYDVVTKNDGLDGLKLLESEKKSIDLVITDLVLPNISGVAVISIVKNKYPDIPVIAITGWGEHPEALAREASADMVMEKPFKLPDLEQATLKLIEKANRPKS